MKEKKVFFKLPTPDMLAKRKVKTKDIEDTEAVLGLIKGEFISAKTPEDFCDWLWNTYLKDLKSTLYVMDGRELDRKNFSELFEKLKQ